MQWNDFLKVVVVCVKQVGEPAIIDCGVSFGKILVFPQNRIYLIDGPPDLEIKPPVKQISKIDDIPECY